MKKLYTLVPLLLLISCGSFPNKQDQSLSRGVTAITEGIEKGRVDVSYNVAKELKQYLPEPKKKISIATFTPKGQMSYVVLPKILIGKKVVVVDSEEWNKLLTENPKLQAQVTKEETTNTKLHEDLVKLAAEKKAWEAEQEATRKRSFFWSVLGWFGISVPFLVGGGLIAIAIFFPALLPLVLNILGRIVSGFVTVGGYIIDFIVSGVKKLSDYAERKHQAARKAKTR